MISFHFNSLASAIRDEAERSTLSFLPNPGNWGAAFTAEATRRFLSSNGIAYREIPSLNLVSLCRGMVRRETLLVGGGGAWSNLYSGSHSLTARASRFFKQIVVLPSTFGTRVSLPNAQLWARDHFSSLKHAPKARFCHDLGFSMGHLDTKPPTDGIGQFFRSDLLAMPSSLPRVADLSSYGTQDSPLQPFLDKIARYEEVHTDRVHVAIVACLMGRRCHVWPTATSLLADLFASSIAPYFPHAVFHGPLPSVQNQNS